MSISSNLTRALEGSGGQSTSPPGTRPSMTAILAVMLGLATFGVGAFAASPATAGAHGYGHNNRCPHVYSYQHGWGGLYTTAGVNFQADDLCNGRHVKRAYVRVQQSGPKWRCQPWSDTGRVYTGTAGSSHEDRWRWSHVSSVVDSSLWGCTLTVWRNWEYF